jgi:hypothetical protein
MLRLTRAIRGEQIGRYLINATLRATPLVILIALKVDPQLDEQTLWHPCNSAA